MPTVETDLLTPIWRCRRPLRRADRWSAPQSRTIRSYRLDPGGPVHPIEFNGSITTPSSALEGQRNTIGNFLASDSPGTCKLPFFERSVAHCTCSKAPKHLEFGGPWGVTLIMILFPLLMWYMWIGATYYDGQLPLPGENQTWLVFARHLCFLIYTDAFPGPRAWAIYWTFLIVEALFYLFLPGVTSYGKPLTHLGGQRLAYHCSGVYSFYSTIVLSLFLHITGLFYLDALLDEFGPLLSVGIVSGFVVSIIAYLSALVRGASHRMSGNLIYDFFMGAELNPRLLWLDFKMFFEVRMPWFILFLLSLAAAVRQIDRYGYISGEVGFILMAHFLYANACCKGEELITTTW